MHGQIVYLINRLVEINGRNLFCMAQLYIFLNNLVEFFKLPFGFQQSLEGQESSYSLRSRFSDWFRIGISW